MCSDRLTLDKFLHLHRVKIEAALQKSPEKDILSLELDCLPKSDDMALERLGDIDILFAGSYLNSVKGKIPGFK